MTFKAATVGMPIYIFDRDSLSLITNKIVCVVPSHFDSNIPAGKMVVDITTENNKKFSIDDNSRIAYYNNSAISLCKESLLKEIEVYRNNSEMSLKDIEKHKNIVEMCNNILIENNPSLKEKRETEARFNNIENSISELTNMMKEFIRTSNA